MLSNVAKAEIIGVLAGCFVASIAFLVFLVCLVCPCPLRAAVRACVEKRRLTGQGHEKSLRRGKSRAMSNLLCCSCCLCRCCLDEDSATQGDPKYDGIKADAADPMAQAAAAALARHHPKERLTAEPSPHVTLTFSVTRQPDCLAVHLYGAEGTPGARLGLCHSNFALVQLVDASSAAASVDAVDAVRTGIVGQTASPVFNETLVLPLGCQPGAGADEQPQQLMLLVRCLDYDRFSRERIVGEAWVPLPAEIDLTVPYNCMPTELPMDGAGELLVALHYMPTAERLSVILLKANDICASDGRAPSTYLHLVLLANGSVVFKKRTRVFDESLRPVYNESVNIDLPRRRLDRVSLIVSVMSCHPRRRVRPDLDTCLGYVVFSSGCYGSGRAHWTEMVNRPRTPLAYWHRLS